MSIIIWVDQDINSYENQGYIKQLEKFGYDNLKLFDKVNNAFDYMKLLKFEDTKIIVSGRLFIEFINVFKENIMYLCFAPKIIIFTRNKQKFLKYNHDFEKIENKFCVFGGIATKFDEIKDFLNKENENIINNEIIFNTPKSQNDLGDASIPIIDSNEQLTFEYIDSKEKLLLPMFFKTLIDKISYENMEEYTKSLYILYSEKNLNIRKLLEQIIIMKNIPIEILSKYYARLFTFDSNFQRELNKDLRQNKKEKYLPYIKIFYEGVKLKSLPLSKDNLLYRGGIISNNEIDKIKMDLKNKIEGLPGLIIFSKSFLSFSKKIEKAKEFMRNSDENLSKVLFILEKDNNSEEYNL